MPTDWHAAAKTLATKRQQSVSELFRSLLWEELPSRERNRLSEPASPGRPGGNA